MTDAPKRTAIAFYVDPILCARRTWGVFNLAWFLLVFLDRTDVRFGVTLLASISVVTVLLHSCVG